MNDDKATSREKKSLYIELLRSAKVQASKSRLLIMTMAERKVLKSESSQWYARENLVDLWTGFLDFLVGRVKKMDDPSI